jgi:hypothetical protein
MAPGCDAFTLINRAAGGAHDNRSGACEPLPIKGDRTEA